MPFMNDPCKLGLDPADVKAGKKTDLAFYDWIAGKDPNKTIADFIVWLFDEFKEEKNLETIRRLLDDWKTSCDEDEFKSRMSVLGKLMPDHHPFHKVKGEY